MTVENVDNKNTLFTNRLSKGALCLVMASLNQLPITSAAFAQIQQGVETPNRVVQKITDETNLNQLEGIESISYEELFAMQPQKLSDIHRQPFFDKDTQVPDQIMRAWEIIKSTDKTLKIIVDPIKRGITISKYSKEDIDPYSLEIISNFPSVRDYIYSLISKGICPEELKNVIVFEQSDFISGKQLMYTQGQMDRLSQSVLTFFIDLPEYGNSKFLQGSGIMIDNVFITNAHVPKVMILSMAKLKFG